MDDKSIRELIEYCISNQVPINHYKINNPPYGVKTYDSPSDIPEQELNLAPLLVETRGYKDECGLRCRELEIFCY